MRFVNFLLVSFCQKFKSLVSADSTTRACY